MKLDFLWPPQKNAFCSQWCFLPQNLRLIPLLLLGLIWIRTSKRYRVCKPGHDTTARQPDWLIFLPRELSILPREGWSSKTCEHKPIDSWSKRKYKFVEHLWAQMKAHVRNWYKTICICKETQFVLLSDPLWLCLFLFSEAFKKNII